MTATPPNWYPDPHNPTAVRWRDGQGWTEHARPVQQHSTAPAAASGAVPPVPSQTLHPERAAPAVESGPRKIGLFGARSAAKDLARENDELRRTLQQTGALDLAQIHLQATAARDELDAVAAQVAAARQELAALRAQSIDVRNGLDVTEFGLYDFPHPAEDSAHLAAELSAVRVQIKNCMTAKRAPTAAPNFMFNNSAAKGRAFVNDMSKMLLAAYSARDRVDRRRRARALETENEILERVSAYFARDTVLDPTADGASSLRPAGARGLRLRGPRRPAWFRLLFLLRRACRTHVLTCRRPHVERRFEHDVLHPTGPRGPLG